MKKLLSILVLSLLLSGNALSNDKIVDLANSKWKIKFGFGDTIDKEFFANGGCARSWGSLVGKQTEYDCTWKQEGRNIEFEYDPVVNYYTK